MQKHISRHYQLSFCNTNEVQLGLVYELVSWKKNFCLVGAVCTRAPSLRWWFVSSSFLFCSLSFNWIHCFSFSCSHPIPYSILFFHFPLFISLIQVQAFVMHLWFKWSFFICFADLHAVLMQHSSGTFICHAQLILVPLFVLFPLLFYLVDSSTDYTTDEVLIILYRFFM